MVIFGFFGVAVEEVGDWDFVLDCLPPINNLKMSLWILQNPPLKWPDMEKQALIFFLIKIFFWSFFFLDSHFHREWKCPIEIIFEQPEVRKTSNSSFFRSVRALRLFGWEIKKRQTSHFKTLPYMLSIGCCPRCSFRFINMRNYSLYRENQDVMILLELFFHPYPV